MTSADVPTFHEDPLPAIRLSIRLKLLATSVVMILFAVAISAVAITQLGDAKNSGHQLYHEDYTPTVSAVYAGSLAKDLQLQSAQYEIYSMKLGATPAT